MSQASQARGAKPDKPRADFPLFAHATGRWAKKVRGKLHYFGAWDDPQAALEKWLDQRDELLAGRTPRTKSDGATVRDLVNAFLSDKKALVETGEITSRRWSDLYTVCERLVSVFGRDRVVDDLQADDFDRLRKSFATTHNLATLHTDLTRVRSIFNWGMAKGRIANRNYSSMIQRPTVGALRRARFSQPKRIFTQPELRALIDASQQPMRAMVLLGINCGYGNSDVALLTLDHLDLDGGWADMPRPKTGAPRRAKLWPETVEAIQEAIAARPKPKDKSLADRVFITAKGLGFEARTKTVAGPEGERAGYEDAPVSKQFAKLLTACKLRRSGNGFYTLRRMFETIGGGCLDQVAVDFVMGHVARAGDMASVYRQYVDDYRLVAVADHVHGWLFPPATRKRKAK